MFRAVGTHEAASERGVVVAYIDRKQIRYCRRDHELVLPREVIRGRDLDPAQAVFLDARARWAPPHQDEPIGDQERAAIAKDIVAACRTFGIETEVVGA